MRPQTGCIVRDAKRRAWFGKWREDVLQPDGSVKRKLVTRKLADICDQYRTERDVRPLLDDIVRPLNEGKVDARSTMTLVRFVDNIYMPQYVEIELKPSTQNGYKKLWEMLREASPRLGEMTLREFSPNHAYLLFKTLREKGWGRHSLYHAKAFLSGVFAHAVNVGALHHNPVKEARMVKTDPPKQTSAATLEQVFDILDAISQAAKEGAIPSLTAKRARAAIALMYFGGLRPGEARGARWEDLEAVYDQDTQQFKWQLTPRYSAWRSHVTAPKTEGSVKPVPVIEPLLTILRELRQAEGNPQSGWILRGPANKPLNVDVLARSFLPILREKGIAWPTYYGLRRGIGTRVTALANPLAAKGLLRHRNVATTTAHYVKDVPEETQAAMAALEQQALRLIAKREKPEAEPLAS